MYSGIPFKFLRFDRILSLSSLPLDHFNWSKEPTGLFFMLFFGSTSYLWCCNKVGHIYIVRFNDTLEDSSTPWTMTFWEWSFFSFFSVNSAFFVYSMMVSWWWGILNWFSGTFCWCNDFIWFFFDFCLTVLNLQKQPLTSILHKALRPATSLIRDSNTGIFLWIL